MEKRSLEGTLIRTFPIKGKGEEECCTWGVEEMDTPILPTPPKKPTLKILHREGEVFILQRREGLSKFL